MNELIDLRLAGLYREAAREEPPAALDAAILAASRREGGARPREVPSQTGVAAPETASASRPAQGSQPARLFPRAWRLPMSLAAVVVLTVSVVALMTQQDGEQRAELMPNPPRPMADGTRAQELRAPAAPAPGAPSEGALQDRRSAMEPETANKERTLERADPAQRPVPAATSREEKPAAARTRAFSAPPVRQSAAPQAPGALAVTPMASTLAAEYAHEPPEKWGEKIVDLRRQGQSVEADALLAEFRRRFPDHVVPEAWRR